MNPYTLKALCAGFHKKTAAELTVNSVDLFLVAANNAVRNAMLQHNFEMTRVSATLDIDGTDGGALSAAVIDSQVNETLTVTNTVAAGTYERIGTFSGYPLYYRSTGTYFLFYSEDRLRYVIHSVLNSGSLTSHWEPGSAGTDLLGSYAPAGGGVSGTATVAYATTAQWNGIKEIVNVMRANSDGSRVPLDFTRADIPVERDRTSRELSDYYEPRERYPSDADILNNGDNVCVIQRKDRLFVYPAVYNAGTNDPLSVILEAYAWLPQLDVVGTSTAPDPNFLFTHGVQWLQWEIILELNYYFQTFVPRQEGVLAPPVQARDTAWRNLLLWDSYMVDSNSNRSR